MCLCSIVMTDIIKPAIVDFSRASAEVSISRPAPDKLLAGTPEQTARNFFSDTTGQFFAGTWDSTPGKWRVRYTENEFCHITRGRMELEDATGQRWPFKAGDSFVIPSGFSGTWHVIEPMSKLYVIFEPASR